MVGWRERGGRGRCSPSNSAWRDWGVTTLAQASGDVRRWRFAISQGRARFPKVRRVGLIAVLLAVVLLPGVLSACGDARPRSVRFGAYVSKLCEAIGPFEIDGQRLGGIVSRHGLDVKSRKSEQAITNGLTAVIVDVRHVVTTLEAAGAPDISDGRALAAAMVATFDQIEKSDAIWRAKLRAGDWAWPTASRMKREHLRTSIEALLLVGRQIERLPHTRERQNAMAGSPVCREVFGSVRVGRSLYRYRIGDGRKEILQMVGLLPVRAADHGRSQSIQTIGKAT
jgi:hypothetical protein